MPPNTMKNSPNTMKNSSNAPTPSARPKTGPSSTGGLSELSKQLRVLQAQNQTQSVEIDRLERQLRILADLQGISIADLRAALRDACESEAHGELQHHVASLRAQLEAASLAKQPGDVEKDSSSHQLANLQLRIGELEEVEENTRVEISGLYKALTEQTAKAARLEATSEQQQLEIERLQTPQQQIVPYVAPDITPDEAEETVSVAERKAAAEKAIEAKVQEEKLAVLQKQFDEQEKQHELRKAQSKARVIVLDERIHDLEQQLVSLYTAFELLRQERQEEEEDRHTLRANLDAADMQVAQQITTLEKRTPTNTTVRRVTTVTPPRGTQQPISPVAPQRSPVASTPPPQSQRILSGEVLIQSSSGLKRWKKRRLELYMTFAHYELHLSEPGRIPVKHTLQVGLSTTEPYPTKQQAFGFLIRVDPTSNKVIYAAAKTERDYHLWMSALSKLSLTKKERRSRNSPAQSPMEREQTDLETALRLSKHEK